MSEKTLIDRIVLADEQGHLQGKPLESVRATAAEAAQQQIDQALAPLEKIPAGGANGEVLARANGDGTQLSWRTVRDGTDGRGVARIEPTPSGNAVSVVMSDGSAVEVPVTVTAQWTPEMQAKAQGYWVEVGAEEAPAESHKYGVPVVWARAARLDDQTPVFPKTPSVNLARRIITIPKQVGVIFTVDGSPVDPGDFTVPGTDRKTVTIEALAAAGYVLPSIFRWKRSFGSIADRSLWASDTYAGRAGEVLVPIVSEEDRAKYGEYKDRIGAAWNNGAGGTGAIKWIQSGPGDDTIAGVKQPNSWFVTENGTITNRGRHDMDGSMVFETGTPNISIEVEIAEVTESANLVLTFGQNRSLKNAVGTDVIVRVTSDGKTSHIQDKAPGVKLQGVVNGGPSVGLWRFDFLDGLITVTSPSGVQVVQDNSPLPPGRYGKFTKIRTDVRGSVKIKSIKVYRNPNE